ncbi:hypothetical protein CT676_37985 [Bradyrhizobium sp. MOS001]|uniref:hypothetical protein n=1 Tax=Bradyrhizobium sp. MOS001 TaxID=2133948 RepID=UPI0010754BA1|nr:hypothetical protein [Bradyrhizobium sp. MOS001]TFW55926.1 hypothetical protein CT676_37985 [Bradyrhizobium sp. MOS001]
MMRSLFLFLIGFAAAISPVLAGMPNPHVERWADHRHIIIGSDLEPQHYATAEISAPDSNAVVNVKITCENGTPGSSWHGYFTILFRQGENVLASAVEHCQINRSGSEKHKKYSKSVPVDLSKVICRVDNVQTSITAAPLAIKPPPNDAPVCEASASLTQR